MSLFIPQEFISVPIYYLESCDCCSREIDELSTIAAAIRALPRETAPTEMREQVAAHFAGLTTKAMPDSRPLSLRRWFSYAVPTLLLVSGCVVFLTSFLSKSESWFHSELGTHLLADSANDPVLMAMVFVITAASGICLSNIADSAAVLIAIRPGRPSRPLSQTPQ